MKLTIKTMGKASHELEATADSTVNTPLALSELLHIVYSCLLSYAALLAVC
jgi:hypothetical protein